MMVKNTKYFHSLEKRHFNSKTISNLKTESNTNISTDPEILTGAKTFYESLYTSRIGCDSSNEYENPFFPM